MGTWGTGLYSSDFGLDVRSVIKAISRLPFDEQRLTDIAVDAFSESARNQFDEDYTTFWLVLADQFHRRGIPAKQAFDTALDIIKNGKDIQVHQDLGMSDTGIRQRRRILAELQGRLEQPTSSKSRNVLKKPQSLLMSIGDVIVYPIDAKGMCLNPYFTNRILEQNPSLKFIPTGWGAAVIIGCGRVFDFLSYYIPLVITKRIDSDQKPTLEIIENAEGWKLQISGTCTKNQFIRVQLEIIGQVKIDERKFASYYPIIDNGVFGAVNNITISNRLHILNRRILVEETVLAKLSQVTINQS
jgi:hypothetical protein